jgi:hypothetical protein
VVEVVVEVVVVVMTPVEVVILSSFLPRTIVVVLLRIIYQLKNTLQKLVRLKILLKIRILLSKVVVVDSSMPFFSNCSLVAPDPSSPKPFSSSRTSSIVSTSAINVFL